MSLPKLKLPTYDLTLPSTGQVLKIRPFIVKEEKILLMAAEGAKDGDESEVLNATKQIIKNCIVEGPSDLDIEKLPTFDIDYLFLKLRAKSIGNKLELRFRGRENVECDECKKEKHVTIELDSIEVRKNPEHHTKIELAEGAGVQMKYPTLELSKKVAALNEQNPETLFATVADCVELIFMDEDVFDTKDYDKDEVVAFLENLTLEQFQKIIDQFFTTMPKVAYDVDLSCKKCGFEQKYTLEGLADFFG